jgi:hypothetical protein
MWRHRQNLLGDFICLLFEWIIELSDNKLWLYGAWPMQHDWRGRRLM